MASARVLVAVLVLSLPALGLFLWKVNMIEGKWRCGFGAVHPWPWAHLSHLRNRAAEGALGGQRRKCQAPRTSARAQHFPIRQGLGFYPPASSSALRTVLHGSFHGSQLCAGVSRHQGLGLPWGSSRHDGGSELMEYKMLHPQALNGTRQEENQWEELKTNVLEQVGFIQAHRKVEVRPLHPWWPTWNQLRVLSHSDKENRRYSLQA